MSTGKIKTQNLLTLISVAILVGTEVLGVALAAAWAIGGLFELDQTVTYTMMALFTALGGYLMWRFMQSAIANEKLYD